MKIKGNKSSVYTSKHFFFSRIHQSLHAVDVIGIVLSKAGYLESAELPLYDCTH